MMRSEKQVRELLKSWEESVHQRDYTIEMVIITLKYVLGECDNYFIPKKEFLGNCGICIFAEKIGTDLFRCKNAKSSRHDEIVEDYIQKLIKFENIRIKKAYFFGFIFCMISLSLTILFSNLISI